MYTQFGLQIYIFLNTPSFRGCKYIQHLLTLNWPAVEYDYLTRSLQNSYWRSSVNPLLFRQISGERNSGVIWTYLTYLLYTLNLFNNKKQAWSFKDYCIFFYLEKRCVQVGEFAVARFQSFPGRKDDIYFNWARRGRHLWGDIYVHIFNQIFFLCNQLGFTQQLEL